MRLTHKLPGRQSLAESPHRLPACLSVFLLLSAGTGFCADGKSPRLTDAAAANPHVTLCREAVGKLQPLHMKMAKPVPGDWLDRFSEPGQTFEEWLVSNPRMATGKRSVLYIQPLGKFGKNDRMIIDQTAEFMHRFFNLKVKMLDVMSLDKIPASARRTHPQAGWKQIQSEYVLRSVLTPQLPEDAAVLIALTSSDLWPGQGWNFVFGQASLDDRVGVWSLARMGDPGLDAANYRKVLLRMCKIATHETGHMFGILHCTAWACNMCGCNHQEEADRHPLWCCPECVAKVCVATGSDPVTRYRSLAEFCRTNGLSVEADFYTKSADVLKK